MCLHKMRVFTRAHKRVRRSGPLKKTNSGLVTDWSACKSTPQRHELRLHGEDDRSQGPAVVDLHPAVQRQHLALETSQMKAHLHDQAAALDLYTVNGNVALGHLVKEVGAVP